MTHCSYFSRLRVPLRTVQVLVPCLLALIAVTPAAGDDAQYPGWGSWDVPARPVRLGINLNPVRRWESEQAFVNVLKSAGPFEATCHEKEACGRVDTFDYRSDESDENGYPKNRIPEAGDEQGWDQVQAAPLLHDEGSYQRDPFVVLYDGQGKLSYGAGIKRIQSSAGREEIRFDNPNGGYLILNQTDPSNPIRNIRVVAEEFENTHEQQPFDPQFLKVIEPFSVIRFMDWMDTNHEPPFEWEQRPQLSHHSWMEGGVPVEMMVRLANTLKADPWFTLPHNSTDAYQLAFAEYVRDYLHPSLTGYYELSNEVWNTIFPQTKWAKALGQRGNPGHESLSISQNYGYQSALMCRNVRSVFDSDSAHTKVKCVASTHTGWPERAELVLDCPGYREEIGEPCYRFGGIDLLGVTTYFGNVVSRNKDADIDSYRQISTWLEAGDEAAKSKMFEYLKSGNGWFDTDKHDLPTTFVKIDQLTKYAKDRGMGLVAYEGGTHLVPAGNVHDDDDLIEWIKSVNRDERMYDLYQDMFQHWASDNTREFITHYSSVARHSKWGSFGLLENMWSEPTPRYRATIDYINGTLLD